jgi:hypothetical protein
VENGLSNRMTLTVVVIITMVIIIKTMADVLMQMNMIASLVLEQS